VGNPPPGLTNHTVALPLAGETTEGEAGCEDFFNSLLGAQLSWFCTDG